MTKSFTPLSLARKLESNIPLLRQVTVKVNKVGGINLGQGTCQLPVPEEVQTAACNAIRAGHNRYTLAQGTLEARQALAIKLENFNHIKANPETEILLTPGVTGAFEAVCSTFIEKGDKVVGFEPYYPYHHNALTKYGADITYVKLKLPDWSFSLQELESALAHHPKFLLINTPNNPTGKVFTETELRAIGTLCEKYGVLVVTDEMYEYMTYDGAKHVSPASLPEFAGRTITMGGYSKTFAITGWRLGYAVGPAEIIHLMTRFIDAVYICTPSISQAMLIESLATLGQDFYDALAEKYAKKRAFFCEALERAGFELVKPQGAYYVIANFEKNFGKMPSSAFVDFMIEKAKVGAVPAGDFVQDVTDQHWVRFCIAVEDTVLEAAAEQLLQLRKAGATEYNQAA